MRVFTFLLSLLIAFGFIILNFLGFNNTLSQTEYMLISVVAEILLSFTLGHFIYRTYANYKKSKQLRSEIEELEVAIATPPVPAETPQAPMAMEHTTLIEKPQLDNTMQH